jgi:hypothetical protein
MPKIKTKPKARQSIAGLTIIPVITKSEADKLFIKSVAKNESGGNNYVDEFCRIADRILDTKRSFSLSDFMYAAKYLDIPHTITAELYSKWKQIMVDTGRLTEIDGCYSETILVQP